MKQAKKSIYYGWWVVGATFTALFIGLSSGFYTVSVFLEPLQEAFGWSKTQVSSGFMAASFLSGFQSLMTGFFVARWGVKRVQLTGALIIVVALMALSMMTSLAEYYLFMVILFTGTSFVGTIPCQTLISQWFTRKRGVAMGLIMAGNGTGGMAMIFIAHSALEMWGWRSAYRTLAALVLLVVFPVILLVTRNRPEDMGLEKDGDILGVDSPCLTGSRPDRSFREAIKTSSFRSVCGLMLLYGMIIGALTQHAIAMLRHFDVERPSAFWSLALGISVGGRLVLGNMADRIPKKILLTLCWICAVLCFFSILLTRKNQIWVYGFSLCYGLSMGSFVTMVPLYISELYGVNHFSKIMGMSHFFLVFGISTGTIVMGRIFDLTGSYLNGVFFLLVISTVGFVVNTLVRES
jgi:MFS family permease